ncbi:hypothetical protein LCGC14_2610190 [marine sediment metagenome]|uniref:Thioesterase domain-containing protein n=1 Tax=marine sediment metagenome TaxID=412755 RepID=A0A0F9A642_9ZZZZ
MSENLTGFNIIEEIPIRWGDMDARGHVNNTLYFRYFESSRIGLFRALKFYKELEISGIGLILAYTHCNFKAPLTYPDTIYVRAEVTHIERLKVIVKHSIKSKKLNREVAEGEAHMIWYNYKERKKASIPDNLKRELIKLKD